MIDINEVIVDNLYFSYDKSKNILGGINLNVMSGDFVCLLGQSGCGKSTLLRLLAGLEYPDKGSITINGKSVKNPGLNRSVVFQDYGLFPWMTVGENINIGLKNKYKEISKERLKLKSLEWMDRVGLSRELYESLPKDISGGQKQRCAIARSFAIDSPILLMDEPFGSLDAVTKAKLQNLISDLWTTSGTDQRKTVFFVTHEVDEALILANNIYVLSQAPSKVMYHHHFETENKPTRETMYTSSNIMELRNKLIKIIYEDAEERIV